MSKCESVRLCVRGLDTNYVQGIVKYTICVHMSKNI